MRFSYPSQRLQDWLSQCWCIGTGKRVEPTDYEWLMGPFGNVDVIEDRYVGELAKKEGLEVHKNEPGFGIVGSMDEFELPETDRARLDPRVAHFYEHTLDYEFEVWSQWCQFYRPFAGAIVGLYTKRLQQLNLPLSPLQTSRGVRSQIYKLLDPATGRPVHTVWYRHLKSSGEVIYSGVYSRARLPEGPTCMKVVFPLPRGNATVVMRPVVDEDGALTLVSKGKRIGDPGFYFVLTDPKGRLYIRYIRAMHEWIKVFVDEEGVLRADHVLNLGRTRVLNLHYRLNPVAHK